MKPREDKNVVLFILLVVLLLLFLCPMLMLGACLCSLGDFQNVH
ncbi:MAG: hypothetical protein AB7N71_04785 [Phycisphaerae bacterium]